MIAEKKKENIIGVDIGGTKINIAVVNNKLELIKSFIIPTLKTQHGDELMNYVAKYVKEAGEFVGWNSIHGIGIGCPGPIDYTSGLIFPTWIPAWKAYPLMHKFQSLFHCPILLENDAKVYALAEAWFGSGKSSEIVVGMVISTGIGAGIVMKKQLFHGATGNAGHLGHVIVDFNGVSCAKGGIGCVTTLASGNAITAIFSERQSQTVIDRSVEEIDEAALNGDLFCQNIMNNATNAIAATIATTTHIIDPDIFVIGGGIGRNSRYLWHELPKALESYLCLEFSKKLNIVKSSLGENAGVLGAAALFLDPYN